MCAAWRSQKFFDICVSHTDLKLGSHTSGRGILNTWMCDLDRSTHYLYNIWGYTHIQVICISGNVHTHSICMPHDVHTHSKRSTVQVIWISNDMSLHFICITHDVHAHYLYDISEHIICTPSLPSYSVPLKHSRTANWCVWNMNLPPIVMRFVVPAKIPGHTLQNVACIHVYIYIYICIYI